MNTGDSMLVILRSVFMALMLIMISAILPDLRLGGRYLIINEAMMMSILIQVLRKLLRGHLPSRERSLLIGFLVIIMLFFSKMLFPGVNLPILGILVLYLGVVLFEMILPDQITPSIWRNE